MPSTVSHATLLNRVQEGKIYVTPAEQQAVRELAWFRAYMDPRHYPAIGVFGSAEVVVRAWEPSLTDEEVWQQDGGDLTFEEWIASRKGVA